MPSKSDRQARAMAAAANSPEMAKKLGIPQHVAEEFTSADKRSGKLKRAMANYKRTRKAQGKM